MTSMTRMPPRTRARARSGAAAASSMVTTGMTGESCRISAMGALVFMRSSSHREPSIGQQLIHLGGTRAIDVARNRMLENRRRQCEVERCLVIERGHAPVQNARCEGIAGADAIHDGAGASTCASS